MVEKAAPEGSSTRLCYENVHEVRVAKAVAAAKRDLIQSLKPHLDALNRALRCFAAMPSDAMPRRWRTVLNPENLTPDRLTLKADPQQTDVQIGLAVGLSDKTVASVRAELVARSEIPSVDERSGWETQNVGAKTARGSAKWDEECGPDHPRCRECATTGTGGGEARPRSRPSSHSRKPSEKLADGTITSRLEAAIAHVDAASSPDWLRAQRPCLENPNMVTPGLRLARA
jgi:hypothetical protein